MHIYFIIYTLVFLTMFADSSRISIQKKKIILFFDIVVLTLFFGLRWQCGTDWWQYYNVFRYVTWSNFYCLNRYGDQNMEIGFAFVNVLLKQFGNYTFYLIVTNFIRFVLMAYVSITLSKTPIVTFFGFLSLQYMFPTRNPYATAIFFVGFIFIVNRNLMKYLWTWILAVSVHVSSIVVAPIYFLYGFRLKFSWQLVIYFSTIFLSKIFTSLITFVGASITFGVGSIDEKVAVYSTAFRDIDKSRGIVSFALPLFFICLFEYVRKINKNTMSENDIKKYDFFVLCYLISTGLWNLLMDTMPDLCRYVEFINTWPLLIPFVVQKYKRYFVLVVTMLIAYYLYRMNNTIYLGAYRDLFVPYKSIWGTF